jgi:hypothetical protein
MVRVRCTKPFYDPDGGNGILRRVNDTFDVRREALREIEHEGLAEPVDA